MSRIASTEAGNELYAQLLKANEDMSKCKYILIVEDDLDVRTTLEDILLEAGYQIASAKNGKEALDVIPSIPRPCLILLDLMMPVMDGWEFLKLRRQDVLIAPIPVVVVSAMAHQAPDQGIADFMRKPIKLDILLKVVEQYCGVATASEINGQKTA